MRSTLFIAVSLLLVQSSLAAVVPRDAVDNDNSYRNWKRDDTAAGDLPGWRRDDTATPDDLHPWRRDDTAAVDDLHPWKRDNTASADDLHGWKRDKSGKQL